MAAEVTESVTKGRGRSSIVASTLQVILSGGVFFLVFRFLYVRLGIDQIGIWSLVLAATSISRIGELGLSAGIVRFVAHALAQGDFRRAADIVQTTALTLAAGMGLLLLILLPIGDAFLSRYMPADHLDVAVAVLPYALASLWINVVASVFSGALDGCHRIAQRCLATGAAHIVFLILVLALTPSRGLEGVAQAQLLQAIFLAVATWFLLRRELPGIPWLPFRWRFSLLREMISYGVSFQLISVINLLFEPVAKALLGKFGGLAALGHFEMANKVLLQGRSVIVEAGRILVPSVASMGSMNAPAVRELFVMSYKLTFFVSLLFYGLLGILLASLSLLWLGAIDSQFLVFAAMLNIGWFVNTLIGPAYFSNLGTGLLRDNVVSHVVMGIVAAGASTLFGQFWAGAGVVAGTVTGLVVGSLYLLLGFTKQVGLTWAGFLVPRGLGFTLILAFLLCTGVQVWALCNPEPVVVLGSAAAAVSLLLAVGWRHPLRATLFSR